MQVTSLEIPDGTFGLPANRLDRLSSVVVLAGRNGSGKSRVLRAVESLVSRAPLAEAIADLRREIESRKGNIEVFKARLANDGSDLQSKRNLVQSDTELADRVFQLQDYLRVTSDPVDRTKHFVVVTYSMASLQLRGWTSIQQGQARPSVEAIEAKFGLVNIQDHLIPAIREIALSHRVNDRSDVDPRHRETATRRYTNLNNQIRNFLGVELGWDGERLEPSIFGLPLEEAGLSDGQKVLLAVATSIALQDGTNEQLVLILDEPENHLHPKALIELLVALDRACPQAQLWVATHSIHVLAHYGERAIWAVEDGLVRYAGSSWSRVLESLLGGKDEIDKARSFLALPAKVAMASFMAQCLLPPPVVDTPAGDPQTAQIVEAIQDLLLERSGTPLRMIDYGMGEGRLLNELIARSAKPLSDSIDYLGVDQESASPGLQGKCKDRLRAAYGEQADRRYLLGNTALEAAINPKSADVFVLCNTLHEIDPGDWKQLLGPGSLADRLLAENGYLFIVEDQNLPDGERAHRFNFLVLDATELKKLFGLPRESTEIVSRDHPSYPGRLKIHKVPRRLLAALTIETCQAAIQELRETAKAEAIKLQHESDAKSGRRYAFWAMQHFNASQALEALSSGAMDSFVENSELTLPCN